MFVLARLERAAEKDLPIMFDQEEVLDLSYEIFLLRKEIEELKKQRTDEIKRDYQNVREQIGGILSDLCEKAGV